jgi:hypothetical protein
MPSPSMRVPLLPGTTVHQRMAQDIPERNASRVLLRSDAAKLRGLLTPHGQQLQRAQPQLRP